MIKFIGVLVLIVSVNVTATESELEVTFTKPKTFRENIHNQFRDYYHILDGVMFVEGKKLCDIPSLKVDFVTTSENSYKAFECDGHHARVRTKWKTIKWINGETYLKLLEFKIDLPSKTLIKEYEVGRVERFAGGFK